MNSKIVVLSLATLLLLAGCSTRGPGAYRGASQSRSYSSTVDTKKYSHPTMRPYVVRGIRYHPTTVKIGDRFRGNASWYGPDFHGKLTSNGERYNMWEMTAAHKTLPMNTIVKVTNMRNYKSAVVRINDRGPFVASRIIDLSKAAASKIDMIGTGTAPVTIEVLGFAGKGSRKIPTQKELKKSPKSVSMTGYAIQIASFSNISGAIITQEKYDKIDGYRTIIKDIEDDNGRLFKVWLEGFKSEEEARDYKNRSSVFKNAFIVKED